MTGLDTILKEIEDEARAAAEGVLAQARKKAGAIAAQAKEQGERECAKIDTQARAEANALLERAESAAALQRRKTVLTAKQQIIGEVLEKAHGSLLELDDKTYFSYLGKMVGRFALPRKGEIMFSKKDKKRLPKGFEEVLRAAAREAGGELAVSGETRPIDGGFVLLYGGVEQNCSFQALFDAEREALQDKVHALLFPG